jgi:hypothetical protein
VAVHHHPNRVRGRSRLAQLAKLHPVAGVAVSVRSHGCRPAGRGFGDAAPPTTVADGHVLIVKVAVTERGPFITT